VNRLALGLIGIVIIIPGFVMTAREIDRIGASVAPGSRVEPVLASALALLAVFFCMSLALQ
jgi:hypothetical protein